jgi:hypothetical protein
VIERLLEQDFRMARAQAMQVDADVEHRAGDLRGENNGANGARGAPRSLKNR